MKKVIPDRAIPVIKMVEAIEAIVNRRKLDKSFHRDEIEKYFSFLIQGKDLIDPYERRDAGISDDQWKKLISDMNKFLGLTGERRQDEKYIFDL